MKRKGYLPKDFEYGPATDTEYTDLENEKGMRVLVVEFKNIRDVIFAFAAVARLRQDRARKALRERGKDKPSFEELTAAT